MSALVIVALVFTPDARAGDSAPAAEASATLDTASHCARSGELIGTNCSYTTGMMARRVLEEGQDWSWTGSLVSSPNNLTSQVAAPYQAQGTSWVIATELVEALKADEATASRLALVGKLLEVDGVRYVVLTSYKVVNS
jgi:hypothetical protein